MSRRNCTVTEITINGKPGIRAECSYCDHMTESLGVGEASRKRCLAIMREECPEDEGDSNFYIDDGG
jgi:hypothetical protein